MANQLYLQADTAYPPEQPVVCRILQGFTQVGADVATVVVAPDQFTATVPAALPTNLLAEGYSLVWVDNDGLTMGSDGVFFWNGDDILDPSDFSVG